MKHLLKAFLIIALVFIGIVSCKKDNSETSTPNYSKIEYIGSSSLSIKRGYLSSTTCGDYAFFAGGENRDTVLDIVDIYNDKTHTWTVEHLSSPRFWVSSAATENIVAFAGGAFPMYSPKPSDVVDFYNINTGLWTKARLSVARIHCTAITVGSKFLFAGGFTELGSQTISDVVDIYDTFTQTWNVTKIPSGLQVWSATSIGEKVYFSGIGNIIAVYDISAKTWSVISVGNTQCCLGIEAIDNNRLIFKAQDKYAVYDLNTKLINWIPFTDYEQKDESIKIGNMVCFIGTTWSLAESINVYNSITGNMSVVPLKETHSYCTGIRLGDKLLIAGGLYISSVEFYQFK